MPTRAQLEQWASDPHVRAFLDLLSYCEGTYGNYNVIFGGGRFSDFSRHPNRKVRAGGYNSEAAGRYQYMFPTWECLRRKHGFSDFGPRSQDMGAIALLSGDCSNIRDAVADLLRGDWQTAVRKSQDVWPSLPTGHQQTRTWTQAATWYSGALAVYGGGVTVPDTAADDTSPPRNDDGGGAANYLPPLDTAANNNAGEVFTLAAVAVAALLIL